MKLRTLALAAILTLPPAIIMREARAAETASACFDSGFRMQMKGDLEGAIRMYTKAIRVEPSLVMAYQMRGAAYQRMKDYGKAMDDYSAAITLGETNFKAAGHYNRGVVKNITGDFAGAAEDFTEALRLDPKMAPAFFHRAVARSRTGDISGRFDDFRSAARLGDHHAEAWLNSHHPEWEKAPGGGGPS